jgi:hypothetical protein
VAAQTTPWQPASCYSMRVGKTVETSVAELCGDLSDVWKLRWATTRLSRGGCDLRLLPGEDLPPPIGAGGGDPSAAAEAVAGKDVAIHWPMRQAVHQLGARPAALSPSSHRSLSAF